MLLSVRTCTTHENWRPQVEPWSPPGCASCSGTIAATGARRRRDDPAAYSMRQVVDDLGRVLDWGAAEQPAVAGRALVRRARCRCTSRCAQPAARARAACCIDTGPGFKNPEAQARWQAQVERTAAVSRDAAACQAFVESRAAATAIGLHPELPAAQRGGARDRGAGRRAARAVRSPRRGHRAARDRPARRRSRSRLWSSWARRTSRTCAPPRCWLRGSASAELVRIPRAGHVVNLEEPQAFDAAVLDFLAAHHQVCGLSDPSGKERNRTALGGFPSRAEAAVDAPDEDVLLMLALRAGDSTAFDALFRRWAAPLLRYLERMLRDAAAAEELVQEVFLRVLRRSRALPAGGALLDLALSHRDESRAQRAAASAPARARTRASTSRTAPELAAAGPAPEAALDARRLAARVEQELARLPERQRAALCLSAVEGLSYAEVAAALEISESAVKALVHRARTALVAQLPDAV